MDQGLLFNTTTSALQIATAIAAKARPRKNILPISLPVEDPEICPFGAYFTSTGFMFAFKDPKGLACDYAAYSIVRVNNEIADRDTDDDCALPELATDGVPFGVVSNKNPVSYVTTERAYISIVVQGTCLVETREVFNELGENINLTIAPGSYIYVGGTKKNGGIPAFLVVYDNFHCSICIK